MNHVSEKDNYIKKISELSGQYGELLIKLMEKHNARNLQEITTQQAKEFYLGLMAAA